MLRWVLVPLRDQPIDDQALARLCIGVVLGQINVGLGNIDKGFGTFPMPRLIGHIQIFDSACWHAFALHFVEQRGKAICQIIKRSAWRKVRLFVQQISDQLDQFKPTPQRRGRLGNGQRV